MIGAGTMNRTRDLLITSQLLYQLSYAGIYFQIATEAALAELLRFRRGREFYCLCANLASTGLGSG